MADSEFLRYAAMGIAGLLRTQSLEVPHYQRSYSWRVFEDDAPEGDQDKLQVIEYWEDLAGSFSTKSPYFLGTVVLAQGDEARKLVIDGQQRLATTSLLVGAIRDRFLELTQEQYAQSAQQEYLGKFDRMAGQDLPKLILNSDDRNYYQRNIVGRESDVEPANHSQALLRNAYQYLAARIGEFADQHGSQARDKLNELLDWLDKSAQVVVIEVAEESDAFLIFETLNDRDADLTVADLLKNYMFSQSGARLDEVCDSWIATLTNLELGKVGNQRFTNFARHLLSSKQGRTREREVYKRLRNEVAGPAQAVSFALELKDSSRIYYALLSSDSEFWADYSNRTPPVRLV